MTQERIQCPFCSELIVRDALKCRFCREWLSELEPNADQSRSIEKIDRAETGSKPHLGLLGDVRVDHLATMEGMGGHSRPIERIEHRGSSLPDESDHPADCTVEARDRVESDRQSYSSKIENIRQHSEPTKKTQCEDSGLSDGDDRRGSDQVEDKGAVEVSPIGEWWKFDSAETIESDSIAKETQIEEIQDGDNGLLEGDAAPSDKQDKGEEVIEASPERVPKRGVREDRTRSDSDKKRCRIPWLRSLMFLFYVGIVAALVISEFSAHGILRDARAKEDAQEYDEAFGMYRTVLDGFPLSFGTIETRQRLHQSQKLEVFEPSWRPTIESLLGSGEDMPDVHLLPLIAWPTSAALLFLVFVTRIFRPRVAFLALLLMIVAMAGSITQLAWYGSVALPSAAEAARRLMKTMPAVYLASYLLFLLTALMTLTATRKRTSWPTAKPDELWDAGGPQR
jgi:hypothetical protein